MKSHCLGGCNITLNSADIEYPYLYYASGTEIIIYNIETFIIEFSLLGHRSNINCIRSSPHGLLSGSTDNSVILWKNHQKTSSFSLKGSVINLCSDANFIIVLSSDGTVTISDPSLTIKETLEFPNNLQEACAVTAVSDRSLLALGGADAKIHLYGLLDS